MATTTTTTNQMFAKQQLMLDNLPAIRSLAAKHQRPPAVLEAIAHDAHPFVVRVPLIGAFSAGKSSLLNALLGKAVFATAVTAETAVPAELAYADADRFSGHRPDAPPVPLTADEVRDNRLDALQPAGWVEAMVNAPILAELPHLRLVDMPGWESGISAHSQAIDHYAPRSLAYGVVVSAEEGNLRDSLRNALLELVLLDMPIIAIISKSDKKPPADIDAIAEQVRQEITHATGKPPLRLAKVSARRGDTAELADALRALEQQAEAVFNRSLVPRFCDELRWLAGHLSLLSNRDDLDSEQINAQIAQLHQEMQTFTAKQAEEALALDAQIEPAVAEISRRLTDALKKDLDSLANKLMQNADIGGDMLITARLVIAEFMRQKFDPAMRGYLERLTEAVPPSLTISGTLAADSKPTLAPEHSKAVLTALATALLTRFSPLAIVIPVLQVLAHVFVDHNAKRRQHARQLESARQELLDRIIPDTVLRIEQDLRPALNQQVQAAKAAIADRVRSLRDDRESSLRQLQDLLSQRQTEFAAARAQHLAELELVQTLLTAMQA